MSCRSRFLLPLITALATISLEAQQSKNLTFDLFLVYGAYTPSNYFIEGAIDFTMLCSAGPLGIGTMIFDSVDPESNNGPTSPVQVTATLYFNPIDTINFTFTDNDPNFIHSLPVLPGGTITGGTGRFAGATGSLDVSFQPPYQNAGTLTFAGQTMPLNLASYTFMGCQSCGKFFYTGTLGGSTSLGNVTGSLKLENTFTEIDPSIQPKGIMTLSFNSADSINVFMNQDPSQPFPIVGGTGAYANASGVLNVSSTHSGSTGYEYKGSGTVTLPEPDTPVITQVKMAFGSSTLIASNGWLQINGTNLAPSDTPAAGVDWSNAPDFASGRMPTRLGAIDSVTVNGAPAYIYYYCSAATNANCSAGDQINVLSPLTSQQDVMQVVVTRSGVSRAPYPIDEGNSSPALPLFDAQGHVAARHLDGSLVGPATLYPGASTPAKAGETIMLVAFGAGTPSGAVDGSATQTGPLSAAVSCWISGQKSAVSSAFISPGLAQLNVTIPSGSVFSGDNPIECFMGDRPFTPGGLIAIQ